jgi:hypothetical protein
LKSPKNTRPQYTGQILQRIDSLRVVDLRAHQAHTWFGKDWAAAYNPRRKRLRLRLPGRPSCAGVVQRFEPAPFVNLLKAASTVSLLTLLSRVTGLVREQLIAALFGAGAATDAFNVAFRIPNLFRRLFAEGRVLAGLCALAGRHPRPRRR